MDKHFMEGKIDLKWLISGYFWCIGDTDVERLLGSYRGKKVKAVLIMEEQDDTV